MKQNEENYRLQLTQQEMKETNRQATHRPSLLSVLLDQTLRVAPNSVSRTPATASPTTFPHYPVHIYVDPTDHPNSVLPSSSHAVSWPPSRADNHRLCLPDNQAGCLLTFSICSDVPDPILRVAPNSTKDDVLGPLLSPASN